MKKYYSILMAAVLVGLAACAKQEAQTDTPEDSPEIVAEDLIVFTATDGETKTKSEIDGSTGKFTWNTTDRIAVHTTAGYKLSATADVDGEDAGLATFTVDKGGAAINGFALSPYTLVYDNTETVNPGSASQWGDGGGDLVVNLPGTYTLADIAGDKSPIPAIAVNEDGDLHFKQLGALLRVTLNNLPPSTRSVTIDFNGKKVQGAFTISSPTPGTSQIATSATDGSDDTITINTPDISAWTDGQVVNIPVPIGEYTTITVTSWNAADGGGTATLTMTRYIKVVSGVASDWTPSRSGARKVIASLPAFSVSSSKRVVISPANLIVNSETYSFQDEPWLTTFAHVTGQNKEYPEFVTYEPVDPDDPEQVAEAEERTIASSNTRRDAILATANRDLFKWDELIDAGESKDFVIDGYYWYLGSKDEWGWMINNSSTNRRTYNKTYHSYAQVILPTTPTTGDGFPDCTRTNWLKPGSETSYINTEFRYDGETGDVLTWGGTPGLFIFPDEWDNALSTVTISTFQGKTVNYDKGDPKAMEINQAVFQQLVDAGAIFIPGVGVILMDGNPAKYNFSSLGVCAGSWSSTEATATKAYDFSTAINSIVLAGQYGKTSMRTVRLVRDIN